MFGGLGASSMIGWQVYTSSTWPVSGADSIGKGMKEDLELGREDLG